MIILLVVFPQAQKGISYLFAMCKSSTYDGAMFTWRDHFPCFKTKGFPKAFLDSAASAQKPVEVLRAMEKASVEGYANIHRGVHGLADAATAAYEAGRDTVRDFIGAGCHESIVFTQGATASINLAAYSLGKSVLKKGDTILVSAMEHHANYLPWLRAAD